MFIRKPYIFFAATLLFLSAQCSTQPLPPISGKIKLSEGWKPMLYAVQPRNFKEMASNFSGIVLDSAAIASDGSFAFPNLEKTFLQLCIQKAAARYPNQLLDDDPLLANYMPIVLEPGKSIEITANAANFQASFSIKNPTAENRQLLQLRDIRHAAFNQLRPMLTAADHTEEADLLEREDALRQFQLPMMTFADSTAYLFPALIAARWVSPAGDYERIPEFLVGQCDKWRSKTPENLWVNQLCQAANRDQLPVLVGDIIPNYALPMAAGDTVLLHDLLGSRLTILDIWASWCMPCRRENKAILAPVWTTCNQRGLQIVGYSIDSSPGAWKAAINKDGAVWAHASHLSGDATPFMEALRVTTIPANFLLDARGTVVAKNLHGEVLRLFVEEYLK